jgi:hypothetical protein
METKIHEATITVTVNTKYSVDFHQRMVDGAEIKATAIAQGVPIQLDFALYRIEGEGIQKPVADDERVTLHEHEKFRAVAPDDSSR